MPRLFSTSQYKRRHIEYPVPMCLILIFKLFQTSSGRNIYVALQNFTARALASAEIAIVDNQSSGSLRSLFTLLEHLPKYTERTKGRRIEFG